MTVKGGRRSRSLQAEGAPEQRQGGGKCGCLSKRNRDLEDYQTESRWWTGGENKAIILEGDRFF